MLIFLFSKLRHVTIEVTWKRGNISKTTLCENYLEERGLVIILLMINEILLSRYKLEDGKKLRSGAKGISGEIEIFLGYFWGNTGVPMRHGLWDTTKRMVTLSLWVPSKILKGSISARNITEELLLPTPTNIELHTTQIDLQKRKLIYISRFKSNPWTEFLEWIKSENFSLGKNPKQ